jgi:glycosyltransferase involved in cell wall biosynthesis
MDQKGNKPERAHSKNRIMDLFGRLRRRYRFARDTRLYREWVRKYDTLPGGERAAILSRIDKLEAPVLISVIMPTFNPPEQWLRKAIESVRDQIYENWELCIADDGSTHPHVRTVLEEYAAADDRIRVVFRRENGNISAASNSALEMARGEFVALMDHDDELPAHALALVAEEIERRPELNLIYTRSTAAGGDTCRSSSLIGVPNYFTRSIWQRIYAFIGRALCAKLGDFGSDLREARTTILRCE